VTWTGGDGGVEPRSSHYSRGRTNDDWYVDDEDAASKQEPVNTLPAAAGDCAPRPNRRRGPDRAFELDNDMYEAGHYQAQKVRPIRTIVRSSD